MNRAVCLCFALAFAPASPVLAQQKALSPEEQQGQATAPQRKEEDARREAAVAEFTRRMRDANYPALFDAAANEFKVPPDILKGVAFAETRWEHLTWPPGETESPETGMPRPYGIMSLWDNKYFGHSLIEAATLIGKDPEELKRDPLQNMRGGAALLRKLYDETPRKDGSSEAQIESWRYAIRAYSGIPEPDLNANHALDVYTFMNQGYHQFGIEWNARPVNLEPLKQETREIMAEEKQKREARMAAETNRQAISIRETNTSTLKSKPRSESARNQLAAAIPAAPEPIANHPATKPWWLVLVILVIAATAFAVFSNRKRKP
jgi:hypothetical protein